MTVLGTPPLEDGQPLLVTRHSLRENHRILRILLVEDNLVNRTLAGRILEMRGHTTAGVRHGREALALLAQRSFDLVLLDMQMPEMEDLKLFSAIREHAKETGSPVKVVAMSAHPMEEERARCLGLGMDGYLSKPFQAQALVEVVENVFLPHAEAEVSEPAPHTREPLDSAQMLAHVDGDLGLLAEMVSLFLDECPGLLSEIRETIACRDSKALERAAHTLHLSLGTFGANAACEAAVKLETLGRLGDVTGAEAICQALEHELERLKGALALLREPDESWTISQSTSC
jgi:CheY-like chemotaxis protein